MEIASRCCFSLEQLTYEYPDEPYEPFASPQEALVHHTNEGLREQFPDGAPEKVREQVERELALIEQLNYARYFLTVFDLIRFAKEKKILCQGRGSAANSVVCYCLGVTGVNPSEIELLFERFISAERGEPPDIDIDFEHERREEVIQHIYEKYGRDRAGIVATVITYRTKSSIRDVGKVFGLSEEVISALSSMMWGWSSDGVADKHIREVGLDPSDRNLRLAVRLARELTGFPRHLSQHTGGRDIPSGRIVKVAGIVLIRQRPGTASGVIFSTLEDETGIANIIIWPTIFERFRRIVLGARLLGVGGHIQSEQGVIHIVARELFDMSGHLAKLAEKALPPEISSRPAMR